MAIAVFILIILVSVVIFVLVDINSKLPARDYGEEALWRDRKKRAAAELPQAPAAGVQETAPMESDRRPPAEPVQVP